MPTVAPLDLSGHCLAATFSARLPHYVLADGTVPRLDNGHKTVETDSGLIAVADDGKRLLTGGEDGRVLRDRRGRRRGSARRSAAQMDHLGGAGSAGSGRVCVGTNRACPLWRRKDTRIPAPTLGRGARVRAEGHADRGGALQRGDAAFFPATDSKPTELEWGGAHMGVTFSPDGAFVVTAMQENALHGWKLADGKHMRMTGTPPRSRAGHGARRVGGSPVPARRPPSSGRSITRMGRWARRRSSLERAVILMVTCVACHTRDEIVAIGYADGMVIAARFADQKEVVLRREGKGAISAMTWDREGRRIAFGSNAGDCGLIDISA